MDKLDKLFINTEIYFRDNSTSKIQKITYALNKLIDNNDDKNKYINLFEKKKYKKLKTELYKKLIDSIKN